MAKVKQDMTGLEKFNRISPATNIVFHVIFILFSLMCVVPVLFILAISVSDEKALQETGYRLIPQAFSFEGYGYLAKQSGLILRALGVSLFVTIVGTIIGVLLTTLMGYVASRPGYRLKGLLTWIIFIPMVFNGGLVSTYFITSQFLGLSDTVWALIFPLAVSSFNVIICKTFFRITIPDSLVESAKMDGATQLTIFFKIVLPISLPVLATIGLFLCFAYWNDWYQSMLYITDQTMYSLQAFLNNLMKNIDALAQNASQMGLSAAELIASMPKEGARMAVAIIIVLPIACAYPFFQQYFISGLTIGAVKG